MVRLGSVINIFVATKAVPPATQDDLTPIGCATAANHSFSRAQIDVTCKDTQEVQALLPGLISGQYDVTGWYDPEVATGHSYDDVFALLVNGTKVLVAWGEDATGSGKVYYRAEGYFFNVSGNSGNTSDPTSWSATLNLVTKPVKVTGS